MSAQEDCTSPLTQAPLLTGDGSAAAPRTADWQPGLAVGPYRLERILGEGGMGRVWLAEQLQPLRRKVAIKVSLQSRPDPISEAFFEIERQAMAQLSHRAIAQIHEAGRLPDGALYFAMEYVPGEPLNLFLAAHPVPMRERVRLIIEVCHAVQHAHQRGLIHRDLKPQNILVQQVDGQALPKIIDFGIAVGVGPDRLARSATSRNAGTPAYMAPEQWRMREGGNEGIDARVDIYALGAILVDLLCPETQGDETPRWADSRSRRVDLESSLRRHARSEDASERRRVRRLHDTPWELRWIAHKALDADREKRYESASALADDLHAWLEQRPVRAVGKRRLYALRCFMRRNRVVTAAAAAVCIALLGGILLALYGMDQALRGQALAEQRRDDGERLIHYMLGDFADKLRPIARLDLLDGVGTEALSYLSAQAQVHTPGSALARARALRTLGEVQTTRQQFDLAQRSLDEAATVIGAWLTAERASADLLFEAGTIAFWRGAVSYRKKDDEGTERHWREYLQRAEQLIALAPEDPRGRTELASAYNNLGTLAEHRQQLSQARENFRRAASIWRELLTGPEDRNGIELANALSWLSKVQNQLGEPRAALASVQEALERVRGLRTIEDDGQLRQQELALSYILATNHLHLGDNEAALPELRRSLRVARQDVANDPSQPRQQALLARSALDWVRHSRAENSALAVVLAEARAAMAAISREALSTSEWIALRLRECLAELALGEEPALVGRCAALLVTPDVQSSDTQLVLRTELAIRLHDLAPGPASLERLQELLNQLDGDGEANSLGRLLLLHSLLSRVDPAGSRVADLDRRITQLRSPVST